MHLKSILQIDGQYLGEQWDVKISKTWLKLLYRISRKKMCQEKKMVVHLLCWENSAPERNRDLLVKNKHL